MKRKYLTRGLGLGAVATVAALTALGAALVEPTSSAGQATEDVDWPYVNGSLDGQRYSPLTQIDTSNVKGLKVAWRFQVKTLGSENYPVIVGRTAYVTTTYGHIYALDGVTGKRLWSYDVGKQKNVGLAAQAAVHGFPNRGVGVGDGRIYAVTPNALLLALDQEKGHLLWKKSIGNPLFLSESAAPIFYKGMVFVGSAGSKSGARGFEAAYYARTGRQIWRHYTIPAPGAPGSWVKGNHGGGAVWMNPTIDAKTGLLYIATGNAGSDFDSRVRPGRNLWADSIVALNAKTGKQVWGYQQEHFDVWDLDSASPPVLFPTKSGLAVGEANSATTAATTSQTPVRASYGVHGVQERSASAAKSPVGSAGSESRAGFSLLGSAMPLRAGQHDVFFGERTTNSGRRKANTECPESSRCRPIRIGLTMRALFSAQNASPSEDATSFPQPSCASQSLCELAAVKVAAARADLRLPRIWR